MHYSELIDSQLFHSELQEGYIKVQRHPDAPLMIYNYTPKASFSSHWNDATLQCRGLILNEATGLVVARPFRKFFNLGELARGDILFSKPYTVTEKMDGSLGICYWNPTAMEYQIATRGSFTSDQARIGTTILRGKYPSFRPEPDETWLFEIIYPGNRIVVDYGNTTDLVLLAVVNNSTGAEIDLTTDDIATQLLQRNSWSGPIVKSYPNVTEAEKRIKPREYLDHHGVNDGSQEGFVFRFDWPKGSHTRVKIKLSEYVRLHKVRTNISTKTIWEALRDGRDIHDLLWELPSDVHEWAIDIIVTLQEEFLFMKNAVFADYELICKTLAEDNWSPKNPAYRSRFAALATKSRWPNEMFGLLEDRNINPAIWRAVQPAYAQPFSDDDLVEA